MVRIARPPTGGGRLMTIGSFDGVHVGHISLLERTCLEAKKRKLTPSTLTFLVPPKFVLSPRKRLKVLTEESEKKVLLHQKGIKDVISVPFDRGLSRLSGFLFFRDILVNTFKAKGLVVGHDFRFGKNRSAGAVELVRWGQEYEIPIWVISPVKKGGFIVSSTRIRDAFQKNQFNKARLLLGHPYPVTGHVVRGRGLGKKLGFPTANLHVSKKKILPRGVFAITGTQGRSKTILKGVCNIGIRPTLRRRSALSVEVHFFKLNLNLHGKSIQLQLHARLRAEKKFPNLKALRQAIHRDIAKAKGVLKKIG